MSDLDEMVALFTKFEIVHVVDERPAPPWSGPGRGKEVRIESEDVDSVFMFDPSGRFELHAFYHSKYSE